MAARNEVHAELERDDAAWQELVPHLRRTGEARRIQRIEALRGRRMRYLARAEQAESKGRHHVAMLYLLGALRVQRRIDRVVRGLNP